MHSHSFQLNHKLEESTPFLSVMEVWWVFLARLSPSCPIAPSVLQWSHLPLPHVYIPVSRVTAAAAQEAFVFFQQQVAGSRWRLLFVYCSERVLSISSFHTSLSKLLLRRAAVCSKAQAMCQKYHTLPCRTHAVDRSSVMFLLSSSTFRSFWAWELELNQLYWISAVLWPSHTRMFTAIILVILTASSC